MYRVILAAGLALREALSKAELARVPEPTADMSSPENVDAFHAEGGAHGALLGVYRFNARAVHALTPRGGFIVDLGCGSGQYLKYLALRRPDLRFLGVDLSHEMVATGNEMLRRHSLADRVELRVGDMTSFSPALPNRVDTIVSVFSLHHLPTAGHLRSCLSEIARLRRDQGSALWIFDHARPKTRQTAERFPTVFTPHASPAFRLDSTNSLMASWSFDELVAALNHDHQTAVQSCLSRLLHLYQVHWAHGSPQRPIEPQLWRETGDEPGSTLRDAKALGDLFAKLPR